MVRISGVHTNYRSFLYAYFKLQLFPLPFLISYLQASFFFLVCQLQIQMLQILDPLIQVVAVPVAAVGLVCGAVAVVDLTDFPVHVV